MLSLHVQLVVYSYTLVITKASDKTFTKTELRLYTLTESWHQDLFLISLFSLKASNTG